MTISMYQASVPVLARTLSNLASILEKGAAHADARKIDADVLPGFRLYPDMLPLIKQVQIACDIAKFGVARLSGMEAPKFDDSEKTLAQLVDRCKQTIEFIQSVKPEAVDGTEGKDITVPMRAGPVHFKGLAYLLGFVMPNVYFHTTTAYDILRHNGVELGKQDFLGKLA